MGRSRGRTPSVGDDDDGAPDRVDIHVGARIRSRRILLDMNQQALAKKLGLTFQQVQKYENGANRVSASRLAAISKVLGVEIGYFLDSLQDNAETPLSAEAERWQERIGRTEALELVRYYYAIPDSQVRTQFLTLIKAAASAGKPD